MTGKLKMQDKLEEAIRLAARVNTDAGLVRIFGLGLHPDGTVRPGQADDYYSRWEYAFVDDKEGEAPPQCITVLYWGRDDPHVDPKAGNVDSKLEIFDEETLSGLHDSDEITGLFCDHSDYKPPAGTSDDFILYTMRRLYDPQVIIQNWKGQTLILDPVEMTERS
jgi:hypothetical protein